MRAAVAAGIVLATLSGVYSAGAATLRDALLQTYATSPVLTAARARLRAIDEGVPAAKAQSRLQVTGTVGVTQSTDGITSLSNGGRVLTGGVNLAYPVFQGGRIRNAINAAEARVVAGRADLRTSEGDLFTQAVSAYMNVIRDQAIVELNISQVKVLETNLRASLDRLRLSDVTMTDFAQSDARLSLARSALATAQGQLTASRETYRRVVGVWPGQLDPPPPLPSLPSDPDDAVKIALDNSPAIQAITANAQAAGYDVATARSQRLPTIALTGGSSYSDYMGTRAQSAGLPRNTPGLDQTQGQSRVGISLTLPLYQGGLASARVRQAQATATSVREQAIDVERQVIANARAAFASYVAASTTIVSNQRAVTANELAVQGTQAENRAGTRTVLEVLNAQQELLNARVQLVTAQRDQYVAGFALLNAMGRAQAADLNLEGGPLYDPLVHYRRVRNQWNDWRDSERYKPQATRTRGPTPSEPDVQRLPYALDLSPGPAELLASLPEVRSVGETLSRSFATANIVRLPPHARPAPFGRRAQVTPVLLSHVSPPAIVASADGRADTNVKPATPAADRRGITIQLGAFSSETQARAIWLTMAQRFTELRSLQQNIAPIATGRLTLYRLRAHGNTARSVCARLKVAGASCWIIA